MVHRDDRGRVLVDTKETHPARATAFGVGIGVLLGVLAGPVGIAIGAVEGAALGAAAGGLIGGVIDLDRAETRGEAFVESRLLLGRCQSAVIADVSEDRSWSIDARMRGLGGTVYRRLASSVHNDGRLDDGFSSYFKYLYPYEYVPDRPSLDVS